MTVLKTNHRGVLVALVVSVLALTATTSRADIFAGSLTSPTGLIGGGSWATGPHTLSWVVSDGDIAGLWHYSYRLSVEGRDISHVIVEVSLEFDDTNLYYPSSNIDLGTYSGSDPSNPGLPGVFKGLKIEQTSADEWAFDFYSDKVPVWGDFYAKTGSNGNGGWIYNVGFSLADPLVAPHDGSEDNHILRPDSVVPVPGAVFLGILGLGVASNRLRRNRAA